MDITYKVGDLKKLISESSNEFKAVIGPGVEDEDKKNNGKAYSDAKKRAKDYDGGLEHELGEEEVKYVKPDDGNKTMLDLNPDNKVSAEKKADIKAQAMGYTSKMEQDNGIEKLGKHSDNFYNGAKEAGKDLHDREAEFRHTGLQHHNMDKKYMDREELYESKDGIDMRRMIETINSKQPETKINEHVKTVYFKKTEFLCEDHVLSRIPDEFKTEGSQFKMKDKTGNEYLVEWRYNHGNIIGHVNKNGLNESLNRMKQMFNYNRQDSMTTNSVRQNGESDFVSTLDKVRKIN